MKDSGDDQIKLSIIIPTYNCEDYVEEALQSVLCQLPDDCELIVVDDGSNIETRNILAKYESTQDNLRIFYFAHMGASGARNRGIAAARGKYVTFLDCDDRLCEGFIEISLELINQDSDLYIFGFERVLLNGERIEKTLEDRVYKDVSSFADFYIREREALIYSACNKFYRRSILEDNLLRFDEESTFGEDRLFNYTYLGFCRGIVTSSEIMFEYMERDKESQSTKYVPKFFSLLYRLHEEKKRCFFALSKGTDEKEKKRFASLDLMSEIKVAINRFEMHPEERTENVPEIMKLISGSSTELSDDQKKQVSKLLVEFIDPID